MAKEVDVKVRYIPDTSALKSALSGAQKVDFKISGGDVKKELLTPVQNAMREVNKALSSGADSKTLLKLFQDVGKAADTAKAQASGMLSELNSVFSSAGNQQLLKDLQKYENELKKVEKRAKEWNSKYGNQKVSDLRKNVTDLNDSKTKITDATSARKVKAEYEAELASGKELTQIEQQRLELLKQYIATLDERNRLQKEGITAKSFEDQRRELSAAIAEISSKAELPEFNALGTKELTAIITQLGQMAGLTSQEINKLTASIKAEDNAAENAAKEGKKQVAKVGDIVTGTFLGTSINNLFQTALQRGIEFFKDYDEILTRTTMVTGQTREEVNALTDSYNRLANQLSSTTKDVAAAQLVFYQQGLGTQEALKMTEASIAISKTGGIEAGEAANRLTAAVRGYQLAADDAMSIADKMSALDAAAASSVDELTIAMQKSASQARMAGLDLDYYMAYLSTMQEVTREAPENIGTAMKSITSRLQEITDLGKVEEDGTTFSNVAKALNSVGIAAVDSAGQLRNLQDIMNELGPIWKDLDRNHRAYLATTLAGNRQQSRFIALMDNYDRALELVNVSQNSSGNTAKQLRAYNQGLEASFIDLSNAWQQFATRLTDTGAIKTLVDTITKLLDTINSLPKGLVQATAGFIALSKASSFMKSLKTVDFKGWLGDITGISKHRKELDNLKTSVDDVNKSSRGLANIQQKVAQSLGLSTAATVENNTAQAAMNVEGTATNAIKSEESAILVANNGAKQGEVQENAQIEGSQETLKAAVEGTTKALKEQNDVYNNNGKAKLTQMEADQRKTRAELESLKSARSNYVEQNKTATQDRNAAIASARAGYEAAIDPATLRKEAESALQEEGLLGNVQQTLFPDQFSNSKTDKMIQSRMNELKKQYGTWYHETLEQIDDIAHQTWDKNNPLVEQLDEQIVEVEKKLKTNAKEITQYHNKINAARKKAEEQATKEAEEAAKKRQNIRKNSNNQNVDGEETSNKQNILGEIIQPYIVKSITEMGTSMLGLSDSVGKVVSGFTSMGYIGVKVAKQLKTQFKKSGKELSNFKMLAIEAGFAIAGMVVGWIESMNSVEAINEKLDKTMSERDSVIAKKSTAESNLKTYTELSKKVLKTEEEQSNLTAAANALADVMPEIVQGYDSAGNALIDMVRAQQELNNLNDEEAKLTDKAIGLYNDKIKVQGKASIAKNVETYLAVATPIATAAGTATSGPTAGLSLPAAYGIEAVGAALVAGGTAIYNWVTSAKDFKDALIEAKDEVIGLLQATTQVPEGMEGLKNTIINAVYNQGYEEEFGPEEMQKRIKDITDKMNTKGFTYVLDQLKIDVEDPHLDVVDFREKVIDGLKKLGFSDEQIDLIYDGVVSIIWEGEINTSAILEQLREYLNGDYPETVKKGAMEISKLESRLMKELYKSGLLTEDMLEHVFSGMSAEQITDAFYSSGIYDETNGLSNILNETYKNVNDKYEKIQDLTSKNGTLDNNIAYQKEELEAARKRWEALGDEVSGFEDPNDVNERDFDLAHSQGTMSEEVYATYKDWKYWNDMVNENTEELEKNKEEIKKSEDELLQLEGTLDSVAEAYMQATEMPTFNEMRETINSAIEPLKSFNSALKEIYEMDGAVTFDSLDALLTSLQQIQDMTEKAGLSTEYWNAACGALADGLSIENGVIHMNMSATEMMTKVAVAGYQAQIKQMMNQIDARISQAETEKQIIQKEIDFMKNKVLNAKNGAEAESMIENDLADYMKDIHVQEIENTNAQFAAQLKSASIYANKMAAIMQKMYNGETVKDSDFSEAFKGLTKGLTAEIKNGVGQLSGNDKWKDNVNAYIARLEEQKKNLQDTIDGEYKLKDKLSALLNSGDLDLGKMLGNGMEKANDEIDEYIGKLERTFNLMQKIERLSHQIADNANLKDLYKEYDGDKYAASMLNELELMQQRYETQKKLFKMQQEEVGRQRGKIEDSPYAGLFSFDSNDLIQIDWEKYHSMSGQDQEEIDTLVDRYEELQDAVESTEIEMAEFAKSVQEAWLEVESTIIDAENAIVEALKNREKIMHEAREKALDDEIDMIEKAVEARQKAQEKESANKELYQAQEALRRATLDSSGKNNASLLQLQQDLEDKQLEISEKRFEDDMEDRKQWLQDTKDAETETYEYRLETMTWYWEQVEEIMNSGTENIMNFLMQWDEQYAQVSETQQERIKRGWQIMYDEIQSLYDRGFDLATFHSQMQDVTDDLASQQINIQSIATAWEAATRAAQTYSASISNVPSPASGTFSNPAGSGGGGDSGKTGAGLQPKFTSAFAKGDYVSVKDGTWSLTSKYSLKNNNMKSSGSTAGWNLDNVRVTDIWFDQNAKQFYYKFDKFGDWWYKGLQFDLKKANGGEKMKIYKTGGLVDYTGPSWVDGTSAHPEAFLNSYQTKQIGALAEALDTNSVNNVSSDSNVTFGSINFNVASMSSAEDGRKALDAFVKGANDMMAKKGIGTKINLNMK